LQDHSWEQVLIRTLKRLFIAFLLVAMGTALYPAWLGFQIWQQSRRDELPRQAGAIVVLGAAQYDGKPSPVFKARLDHAAYLYRQGFSPNLIVMGGQAPGDTFSEGDAGAQYLETKGIPAARILIENQGRTTLESMGKLPAIVAGRNIKSLLLVSDPLHSKRIKRIATDLGFSPVYASPASYLQLARTRETKARELLHEVTSLAAYELFRQG
jgi:uncharacterized SAM-binding protein YcdF (DUF218 family)